MELIEQPPKNVRKTTATEAIRLKANIDDLGRAASNNADEASKAPNFKPTPIPELPNSPACSSREESGFCGGNHYTGWDQARRFELRMRSVTELLAFFRQGETDVGDKGKRDKGKREQQKKAKLTQKQKRKAKQDKKNKLSPQR